MPPREWSLSFLHVSTTHPESKIPSRYRRLSEYWLAILIQYVSLGG
jgi:hypothetical protein